MVPLARGRLRSRPVTEIIDEVYALVDEGYQEVILLGQNVNAYRSNGSGFGELLRKVSDVHGLMRVRFLTSHPKDLDDDLIEALAIGGNICPDLHLPVQSGSDKILWAMNRGYTREHYFNLIRKLRTAVHDIAFSTDAIVGFPGETEQDFQDTLSLFEEVGYASGFVFRYSPRPRTIAYEWKDDVPDKVKTERLIRLNEALADSRNKLLQSQIGKKLEVLVEGFSRKHPDQITGCSRQGFVVAFPADEHEPGDGVSVLIEGVVGFTLLGNCV